VEVLKRVKRLTHKIVGLALRTGIVSAEAEIDDVKRFVRFGIVPNEPKKISIVKDRDTLGEWMFGGVLICPAKYYPLGRWVLSRRDSDGKKPQYSIHQAVLFEEGLVDKVDSMRRFNISPHEVHKNWGKALG
jgi:hypothetical protein